MQFVNKGLSLRSIGHCLRQMRSPYISRKKSRHPVVGTNCEEYPFSAKIGTDRGCSVTVDGVYIACHGECPMYNIRKQCATSKPPLAPPPLLPSPFSPHAFFIFGRKLPTERQNRKRVKNHLYEMQHDSAEKETMLLLLQGLRRCASGS